MARPRLLDLYCAAGGAGMGYHRAGFDVVGVGINPQPHFPFEFIQGDCLGLGLDFLRSFDAIHASPPCQHYSAAARFHGNSSDHPDLVAPTRDMLVAAGLPWIIENVEGAPIRADVMLCGSMFGLRLVKHRFFELSFPFFALMPPCDHADVYDPWHGAGRSAAKFRQAQDTPWIPAQGGSGRARGVTGDVFNAIPPAYTEFLGRKMLAHIQLREAA